MYRKFVKRFLDFTLALLGLVLLVPLYIILALIGGFAMKGNPFFVQLRPGKKKEDGKERIFKLVKFRTMSNAKDEFGNLLSDEKRLNAYGSFLRKTSLDELGELWNILVGDMSIVGPRPQLVRDMVFMTERQRKRHDVRPGLTGLAQVSGRNSISWEQKFQYDLQYVENKITFLGDLRIVFQTVGKVFRREDVVREGTASDIDLGDYLLESGKVDLDEYNMKMLIAKKILEEYDE